MLKSTGSAFENFVRDEYTTLAEVNDRIFSTSVDLAYTYAPLAVSGHGEGKELEEKHVQTKVSFAVDLSVCSCLSSLPASFTHIAAPLAVYAIVPSESVPFIWAYCSGRTPISASFNSS